MTDLLGEGSVKKAVRARDGYACTKCGMSNRKCQTTYGRSLHVHRIVPGSRYTVDGCTSLCRRCHQIEHGHVKLTMPTRTFPELAPPTQARQFRLGEETVSQIEALAAKWGGTVKPLSHTEVIREAIRMVHNAEIKSPEKS
jgi:hypothetical protein